MTTHALHPDQLKPGDMVGPWLITGVLGSGGSSRVFKVERDGRPYSMKLALRPLSELRVAKLHLDFPNMPPVYRHPSATEAVRRQPRYKDFPETLSTCAETFACACSSSLEEVWQYDDIFNGCWHVYDIVRTSADGMMPTTEVTQRRSVAPYCSA